MKNRAHATLRNAVRVGARVALAMAASILGGAATAGAPSHCVALDVPAPVILPDGSIHPAGEMRLCLTRNYNPVMGLHRIYIAHRPVSMLLSRASLAEVPKDSPPTVLFHGNLRRGLRLVGYTVAVNGKVHSYLLWSAQAERVDEVAGASSGWNGDSGMDDSESVLLAARLD